MINLDTTWAIIYSLLILDGSPILIDNEYGLICKNYHIKLLCILIAMILNSKSLFSNLTYPVWLSLLLFSCHLI